MIMQSVTIVLFKGGRGELKSWARIMAQAQAEANSKGGREDEETKQKNKIPQTKKYEIATVNLLKGK